MKEVWKWIIGLEGKYMISNHGRVKSVGRLIGNGKKYYKNETIVNQYNDKDGYKFVILCLPDRKHKTARVHKEVIKSFVSCELLRGYNICHRNGDINNNSLSNLYIGNHITNTLDKYKHGTTKLSISQVLEIRDLAKTMSQYQIAKLFGIRQSYVSRIINKVRCKYINPETQLNIEL